MLDFWTGLMAVVHSKKGEVVNSVSTRSAAMQADCTPNLKLWHHAHSAEAKQPSFVSASPQEIRSPARRGSYGAHPAGIRPTGTRPARTRKAAPTPRATARVVREVKIEAAAS
mmetsp:Transcript_9836/g.24221  ORF Transcript_9836/g.24221 Transcript_9836/m.24221 type:complete len:113 (+) Transcript_9836:260-598(+)